MTTQAEENYIKAIYKISEREQQVVSTNAISREIQTSAASVTDMIKRLSEKKLVDYRKYKGVVLTQKGRQLATQLIRKHRLWEVFLARKLRYGWDRVHDLAEELEHIGSEELIDRLDEFLDFPRFDPHGDPIPNSDGKFTLRQQLPLANLNPHQSGLVVGVREHSDAFLRHLDELGIALQKEIKVLEHFGYDQSMQVLIDGENRLISAKVAKNVLVKPENKATS